MPKYLESPRSKIPSDQKVSAQWWNEQPKDIHRSVRGVLDAIRETQRARDADNRLYYSMYMGRPISGIEGDMYSRRANNSGILRLNVARTTCAAANSKVAKDKVRVLFLTEGGNWLEQARGKRLTKLINGLFYNDGLYDAHARAQLASTIFDIGATHIYRKGKRVVFEAVPGSEIRVDAWDGRYGRPSSLFRDMVVPRNQLIVDYPAKRDIILAAKRAEHGSHQNGRWIADCIEVTYAWHLRSEKDADDGFATVCLENGTLEHEPYERDYFPFVWQRWEENPLGFYGQSICAQLPGIADNVNKTAQDIQDHCDLSTGFVAIPTEAAVSKAAWTNEVWRKIEFSGGAPPTMVAPPAFQPEKLQWLQFLLGRAPQEVGLSEMSVTSQKPAGLNSGKALREYNDLESERFQMVQQRYEQSFMEAAEQTFDLCEEIYGEHGDFEVKSAGQRLVETINWKKARLDRENFVVRPVPTSFLPSTPSAKLETIQEMLTGGMLSRDEAMILLDYPDLESVTAQQNAPRLNIERRIEDMLDPDKPKGAQPEAYWNLQMAMTLAQSAYNDAEQAGAPEKNLNLLRIFMSQIQAIVDQQQADAQAQQQPAPATNPAGPIPPPAGSPAPPPQGQAPAG